MSWNGRFNTEAECNIGKGTEPGSPQGPPEYSITTSPIYKPTPLTLTAFTSHITQLLSTSFDSATHSCLISSLDFTPETPSNDEAQFHLRNLISTRH